MKEIQTLNRGINQDAKPELQPDGTYRFQLNGLFETLDGERGGITNERGNEILITIPSDPDNPISDLHINGHCLLPNQDVVLFITAFDEWQTVQIIALHKNNNTYLELIRTNGLEWSKCDQIDCIFKIHNGCDVVIYFTDHKNKYKSINLSSVENTDRYREPLYTNWEGNSNPNIPTVQPSIGIGDYGWLTNAFYLTPVSTHPNIYFKEMGTAGNLRVGAYTFFIRLMDIDLNPTNWLTWTNPIFVKKGQFNFNDPPDNTDGYYLDLTIDNFTSASITLLLENLDTSFRYYEIGIMERSLNTNLPSYTYRSGPRFLPPSGSDIFVFNNVFDSRYVDIPISSLLVKNRSINTVQAHAQIANRLVLGNLTGSVTDWAKFQKAANNIQVEYFTYNQATITTGCEVKKHAVVSGPRALPDNTWTGVNFSSPDFLSYGMSLMRDEVYALGIIYVFKDGTESPVFHIPGRPKFGTTDPYAVTTYEIDGFDYADYALNGILSYSETILDDLSGATTGPFLTNFDDATLTMNTPHNYLANWESDHLRNLPQRNYGNEIITDDYKYLYGWSDRVTCCYSIPLNDSGCGNETERWMYYNTAIRRKEDESYGALDEIISIQYDNPTFLFEDGFRGVPGYYDTGIPYPEILDCDGTRIFPEGNVRHHKIPDHRIEQLFDTHGGLGFPEITSVNVGWSTRAGWLANSNIGVDNRTTGARWTMNDSESLFKIYPLGLIFHNVAPPEEYRDQVVGYYMVRSDRSNNKTVIDKGFMNVCDTSVTFRNQPVGTPGLNYEIIDEFTSLSDNRVFPNNFFLTPTHKPGTVFPVSIGDKYNWAYWNIMEIHSPKADYNEPVVLGVDYIKLESTVFGDLFFDTSGPDPGSSSPNSYVREYVVGMDHWWNTGVSAVMNRHKYPRVQSPDDITSPGGRDIWEFIYNIPISGMDYVNFNTISGSNALGGNTEIYNAEFQQQTLVARFKHNCTPVVPTLASSDPDAVMNYAVTGLGAGDRAFCGLNFPFHYEALKLELGEETTAGLSFYINGASVRNLHELIIDNDTGAGYANYQTWGLTSNVTTPYKWSIPHSPYMYYVGLKAAISPYQDFDSINYIKMHSYMIPSSSTPLATNKFPVTGGDTFINRFQFEKQWYSDSNPGGGTNETSVRFISSLTVGYVESEINTAFKHLLNGDLFRTFPFDSRNAIYEFLLSLAAITSDVDSLTDTMNDQNIVYRYKLDYSNYNSEIISIGLPSTFDYCSECVDSFPNTLVYSEISLDSQVQDYYKLFLTNNTKDIPSSTGSVQDMFIKNSDLYIHTLHNLWKISVAPQTMQTSSDTVEVGQGGFLERDPVKIFNNDDAFSRGGIQDKFSAIFAGGSYIWMDRNSGIVFSLSDSSPEPLSDKGLIRWFANNSELTLDTQFMELTGLPYPYKGTACNLNVGYIAVYDPEHKRYILTKRDYRLLETPTELVIVPGLLGDQFDPAIVTGQTYYDGDGFYIGIADGNLVSERDSLLTDIDLTDKSIAENRSWTVSYSILDQAWASWHSYIPNWIYNDSGTFYSFITNPTDDINTNIWMHNYGDYHTYYGTKQDYIIDYIYKKKPYMDKTFDTIEYTSNVWLDSSVDEHWIEAPFITFDRFYVYNNTQLSNMKDITVSNMNAYSEVPYTVTDATAHQWRDTWRISRFRDQADGRLAINEPKFTKDWSEPTYQDYFDNGFGYIDKVINPSIIDLTKSVYQLQRFTDKYLGVRLFFKPDENYKITLNLISGEKRPRF
jgi:hypothetical protein